MTRRLIIAPVLAIVPLLLGCEGQGATSIGAPVETTAPSVALPASGAAPDKGPQVSTSEKGAQGKAEVGYGEAHQEEDKPGVRAGAPEKKKGASTRDNAERTKSPLQPVPTMSR